MEYMMMFYETPQDFAGRQGAEAAAHSGGWMAYVNAMVAAGVMTTGNALLPPASGTTLRLRADKRQVQDGPFADTKEQLGGYALVEVPDLDTALAWAARAPCAATGSVELRAIYKPPM